MVLVAVACLFGLLLPGCQSVGSSDDDSWLSPIAGQFLPPSPGQLARDAFNVYDPDKRRNSIALLSTASFGGEEPYLRMYRLILDDPDASVRAACIRALGLHGHREDVLRIVPYLEDATGFVRWESALALQKLHHPEAVGPLIKALSGGQ